MKKNVWLLGVAVAALTSCTQSEVLDIPESRVIGFEPFVGKSTRAADVKANMLIGAAGAANDLTEFWVFASYEGTEDENAAPFDGTDNSRVYWDGANSAFKYDSPRQWHLGTYQFAAYSNGNEKIDDVTFNSSSLTFTDYVNSGNMDLVAAIPAEIVKNSTNMNVGVPLSFKHMLACVELEFTNNSISYYLDFQNLKFSAKSTSTCTYDGSNISWTNPSDDKEYEFITNTYNHDDGAENNDPNVLLAPAGKAKFHCFVIPQENQNIELTFDVVAYIREDDGHGDYNYIYTSTDAYEASLYAGSSNSSWQPGKMYKYYTNISGNTHYITFTVTSVDDWTDVVDSPITPAAPSTNP